MRTPCAHPLLGVASRSQQAALRDLADGYTPAAIAERRGVRIEAVLELRARRLSRLARQRCDARQRAAALMSRAAVAAWKEATA